MYLPDHFSETRSQEIKEIISRNPLATLVTHHDAGLLANPVPLIWDGDAHLIGHVAKGNDFVSELEDGVSVMAIFTGACGYVSPNWCPSKGDTHMIVPTWNYQTVHVHGRLTFENRPAGIRKIVNQLTTRFEKEANGDQAWKMADAPDDWMTGMIDRIVGIRIEVDRIDAKSKLSQNREARDFDGIVEGLEKSGEGPLVEAMRGLQKS